MTDTLWYTLGPNNEPVPCYDVIAWSQWRADFSKRVVKQEVVGDFWVSTVFLGMDHSFMGGPPILWETMIFDRSEGNDAWNEQYCDRYTSHADALVGHAAAVVEAQRRQEQRSQRRIIVTEPEEPKQ